MAEALLSNEIALRIGLAARALDVSPKDLLEALATSIGLPLDDSKLKSVTKESLTLGGVTSLSDKDDDSLQSAISILQQPAATEAELRDPEAPELQEYKDGEMPGSIRIACATNGYEDLDGHFGSCQRFMVYQVSQHEARLVDIRSTRLPKGTASDDKNAARAEMISDCDVLYVGSIGGPAAAKVVKAGIHPIKLPGKDSLTDIIEKLQSVLAGSPPPWLAKVMGMDAEERIRFEREVEDNDND